ncbi:hypothetical protein FQN54_003362 [Arachnomyces sp. PD_36]|nr:hypothetical protein FQN54_003362 [Arachnomyces sp. PD_36]
MAPLVWINGFPGSGKLTIATAIAQLHEPAVVLDNHKLIDPVEARCPRTHPDYNKERRLYRQAVLDEFVCDETTLSKLVIFTDFQSSNELGRDVAMEYRDAARRSGRPFIPVYLTCDMDANVQRIASLERVDSGTKKLTDAQQLQALRGRCELFRFDECPSFTVDSTHLPPLEAAAKILAFLKDMDSL